MKNFGRNGWKRKGGRVTVFAHRLAFDKNRNPAVFWGQTGEWRLWLAASNRNPRGTPFNFRGQCRAEALRAVPLWRTSLIKGYLCALKVRTARGVTGMKLARRVRVVSRADKLIRASERTCERLYLVFETRNRALPAGMTYIFGLCAPSIDIEIQCVKMAEI